MIVLELIVICIVLMSLIGIIGMSWVRQVQRHENKLRQRRWMKEHLRQLKKDGGYND